MRNSVAAVEAILRQGVVIRTRLRERTAEEVVDLLPIDQPAIPGVSAAEVVAALITLEQRGVVRRARGTGPCP